MIFRKRKIGERIFGDDQGIDLPGVISIFFLGGTLTDEEVNQ
jgi:hypothetical protein